MVFTAISDAKLVSRPLVLFAKLRGATGDLQQHASNQYHKASMLDMTAFLRRFRDDDITADIANQLEVGRLRQVQETRERLRPIIKTIIFLGQQGIALRGRRDDGRDLSDETAQGNFRELLKFRIESGYTALEQHMQTASARATYISKTTQNELISVIGTCIQESILDRVRRGVFYSVIIDETTDVSIIEQFSLSIRHVFENSIEKLCETRWVERHDAVLFVHANLREIHDALCLISENWMDSNATSKADGLLRGNHDTHVRDRSSMSTGSVCRDGEPLQVSADFGH
jgi:hypothetical protein